LIFVYTRYSCPTDGKTRDRGAISDPTGTARWKSSILKKKTLQHHL